jgi:hypothetical protein
MEFALLGLGKLQNLSQKSQLLAKIWTQELLNIVTCISDHKFGMVNRFIDPLLFVTANNYNTIADFNATNHSTLSLLSLVFTW